MDRVTATLDDAAVRDVLRRFPDLVLKKTAPASMVTARRIASEASRRIARAAGGPTRGRHTAEGIGVEPTHDGTGAVVFIESPEMPNLPLWLERGTTFMTARPFFGPAVALEQGPHVRRIGDAVQAVIEEVGLGG